MYIRGDLPQACTVQCEGHRPKVLLWIMEEFFYILHDLTEEDCDGCIVLGYELMIEAEHWYRIKGRGIGCHHSPSHASSALPCSQEMLEHIAWGKPDSKTLDCLVWSVYNGLFSLGPTPKLAGPESYNQVTRCLAAKVFRGLQVHCLARTSAQFDEPPQPKVQSVVLAPPQSEITRKTEAMGTASPKVEDTEEGAVGGELCVDPDKHLMAWMRDHQHWYDDEMINFWPLLHPLTDGKGTMTQHLACCLLSMGHWSSVTHPTSCLPPQPIWRSGDGCHWTGREVGKTCG